MRKSDYPQYYGGEKKSRGPRSFSHLVAMCHEWYDNWYSWTAKRRRTVVAMHLKQW